MSHIRTLSGDGSLSIEERDVPVHYRIDGYWSGHMKTATGHLVSAEPGALWAGLGKTLRLTLAGGAEAHVIIAHLSGGDAEIRCTGPVPGI